MIPIRSFLSRSGGRLLIQRSLSLQSFFESSPVLISSNKDIYTNLALEHLLYNNLRFHNGPKDKSDNCNDDKALRRPVVLIWTDEPCVVIGRHQNPWIEANIGLAHKASIKLARRHSGGGCVFHDENNINISIIDQRGAFEERRNNLSFLANFLDSKYGIKCEPTKRHDLIHKDTGHKLTGSAAKLGRYNCYHHFTLLVNTDKEALYTSIRQDQQDFVQTNSTSSTRSKVINLADIKPNLNTDQVISDLTIAYSEHYNVKKINESTKKQRIEVSPAEAAELKRYKSELESWDWIYGMTPKFKLERAFPVIDRGEEKLIKFTVSVNKGIIDCIKIEGSLTGCDPADTFKSLIGTKLVYNSTMVTVSKLLQDSGGPNPPKTSVGVDKLLGMFLLQMIQQLHF